MSITEEVDCLRRVPLFANLEQSKLKLLAFTSERVTFRSGEVLFDQDEMGTSAYIILCGETEVVVRGPNGPVIVDTVGSGEVVGEIAILCDVPRTATVRARTQVEALCISKDLFFRMLAEFPQIAVEIMRVLAHRLEKTTARLMEVIHDRAGTGI